MAGSHKEVYNEREEWFLEFFGSYEDAAKYGPLFVLEYDFMKIEEASPVDSFIEPNVLYPSDNMSDRIEQSVSIRPKTYFELHDEGLIGLLIDAVKDPLFQQIGKKGGDE